VKNIVLFLKKLLLFEIPYSIFDIQNEKHAKAIRLKGEGFKPGEWKNKGLPPIHCWALGLSTHSSSPCLSTDRADTTLGQRVAGSRS